MRTLDRAPVETQLNKLLHTEEQLLGLINMFALDFNVVQSFILREYIIVYRGLQYSFEYYIVGEYTCTVRDTRIETNLKSIAKNVSWKQTKTQM